VPDVRIHSAEASEARQRRVAGALASAGLGPGDRVVLCLPSSPAHVDAVLGASRTGVVPVPLDPRLTPHERDVIIDDVAPALVVDDMALLEELLAGPESDLNPWPRCRPMHFTSGTTGRPKGVWSGLLSADDARALAMEERDLWELGPDDVHLVVSPTYHSAPLRFATGTLLAGGSIAVLARFDAADLIDAIGQVQPTTMFCVPAHLQRLFAHVDDTGVEPDLSSLRLVAHAGAPCPEPVRRRAHAAFGQDVVWEFYGSTEGQLTACSAPEWHQRPGTVGRARPGRVVSRDEEGLLWCAVPRWARFEYWNDPEKTTAAWRTTPDGPAFTVRDLGRIDDDGYVHLDSRREDLIITGGVNVYPAEVEAALEDVDGLVEVAVFGQLDDHWGQRVCAAYVGDVPEDVLRTRAADRLAPPKRPKEYQRLDALPRTPTGKVRRTHL
jgi:long-chain acyl-CoA synthetase